MLKNLSKIFVRDENVSFDKSISDAAYRVYVASMVLLSFCFFLYSCYCVHYHAGPAIVLSEWLSPFQLSEFRRKKAVLFVMVIFFVVVSHCGAVSLASLFNFFSKQGKYKKK